MDGRRALARGSALWWQGAFAVCLLLSAGLTLAYGHPPLVDWPEHLAQDAIVAHRSDAAFGTSRYYELTGWFLPYQGFRWLHIVLGKVLGMELGGRVALLGYLLGAPLAWAALLRRLGRDPWLALGCATVLVEANFLWGFAPHALGTALLLGGVVLALDALLRAPRWRLGALSLWGCALFFTHLQQTAVWLLSVGALAVTGTALGAVRWRRGVAVLASLLPSLLLAGWYLVGRGWWSGSAVADDFGIATPTVWHTLRSSLEWAFFSAGLTVMDPRAAVAFGVALGAAALLCVVALSRPAEAATDTTAEPRARWAGPVLLLLWASLYFCIPGEWRGQTLAPRNASLMLLGLLLGLPTYERRPQGVLRGVQLLARGALLAAGLGALLLAHREFRRFDRGMAPLAEALPLVPVGSRVATVVYRPRPWGFRLPVALHLGGYVLASRGGLASFGFTRTGVTYQRQVSRWGLMVLETWRPSDTGWVPEGPRFAPHYDYVLVFGSPPGGDFGAQARDWLLELRWRRAEFSLWRVRGFVPRSP